MSKIPFAHFGANANKIETITHNGYCTSRRGTAAGISSTKGFYFIKFLGSKTLIIGRDGVAKEANREVQAFRDGRVCSGLGHAIKGRLLGVVDVPLTAVTGSVGAAVHGSLTTLCLLGTVVTAPLALKRSWRIIPAACLGFTAGNAVSTLANIGGLLFAPLEVVAPEINAKLLKTHHWGPQIQGID